jgi:hypothetical protein
MYRTFQYMWMGCSTGNLFLFLFFQVAVEFLELELEKGEGAKLQWKKQIRYRLRLLGRFVLEARKIIPGAQSLSDILRHVNFLLIVKAAKKCGQKGDGQAEGLSVPVKVGFVLKAAVEVILATALLKEDEESKKRAQDAEKLLKLYDMQWGTR